jgi:hypothetical protein
MPRDIKTSVTAATDPASDAEVADQLSAFNTIIGALQPLSLELRVRTLAAVIIMTTPDGEVLRRVQDAGR